MIDSNKTESDIADMWLPGGGGAAAATVLENERIETK